MFSRGWLMICMGYHISLLNGGWFAKKLADGFEKNWRVPVSKHVETIGSFHDIDMSLEEQNRAVLHGKFLIIASHCYMLLPRIPEKWHQNK
jgi:hypothetical protein